MNAPIDIILNALTGSLHWFYRSIVFDVPWSQNYFWGLTIISFVIWGLEMLFPWRKNQSFFRKDFWLDAFYMYFNFFIFHEIMNKKSNRMKANDENRPCFTIPIAKPSNYLSEILSYHSQLKKS